MKNPILLLAIILICVSACNKMEQDLPKSPQKCNGQIELCDKTYDEVVFACTHNSYNYKTTEPNFVLPNQNNSIEQQLEDGVRALMLDIHYPDEDIDADPNSLWLYHSVSFAGFAPLSKELEVVKKFLKENPGEIVTLILETYVSYDDFKEAIEVAGLNEFLHRPTTLMEWPTLKEMVDNNQRLVVLTDEKAESTEDWYINVWGVAVETHYSNKSRADFKCNNNRGNPANQLFIFNHFITHNFLGTGLVDSAKQINKYNYLLNRIQDCESHLNNKANFITVDFYKSGDVMEVVQFLNEN